MTREEIAALDLIWKIFWPVLTLIGAWLIGRGRAHKSELAEIRADLNRKADKVLFDEQVEALAEKDKVDRHESKLTEHDRRVQKLEGDFIHLPSLDLFHQLALDLRVMQGDLKTMAVTMKSTAETTRRIDDWLRENK